jgi:hypothetical protein
MEPARVENGQLRVAKGVCRTFTLRELIVEIIHQCWSYSVILVPYGRNDLMSSGPHECPLQTKQAFQRL